MLRCRSRTDTHLARLSPPVLASKTAAAAALSHVRGGGAVVRDARGSRGARMPSPSQATHWALPAPWHLRHLFVFSHCVSYSPLSSPTSAFTLRDRSVRTWPSPRGAGAAQTRVRVRAC